MILSFLHYRTGEEGGLITTHGWAWATAHALVGREIDTMMNKLQVSKFLTQFFLN
jgi:hypothetical protein